MMRCTPSVIAYSFVAALAGTHALDVGAQNGMRCRSGRLINVGMIDAEVRGRCGEPKIRTVEEAPILRPNPINGTVAKTGEVTRTERWTYQRGQGQFDALLTFEDGKLRSIEFLSSSH